MNKDLKITKTEIRNISAEAKKNEESYRGTLQRVMENEFHKGLEELFEIWTCEGYEDQIKFYRSRKDREEFLKNFESELYCDFMRYPMSFYSLWKYFKEWYDFKCDIIYNTYYLDEKSYR